MTEEDAERYEQELKAVSQDDIDFVKYRKLRKQQRSMKLKSNVELLEQFNLAALKFMPLYKKRIDQVEEIERINMMIENDQHWQKGKKEARNQKHQAFGEGVVKAQPSERNLQLFLQTAISDQFSKVQGFEQTNNSFGPLNNIYKDQTTEDQVLMKLQEGEHEEGHRSKKKAQEAKDVPEKVSRKAMVHTRYNNDGSQLQGLAGGANSEIHNKESGGDLTGKGT
jgi:hypothetical protein